MFRRIHCRTTNWKKTIDITNWKKTFDIAILF